MCEVVRKNKKREEVFMPRYTTPRNSKSFGRSHSLDEHVVKRIGGLSNRSCSQSLWGFRAATHATYGKL